jgi:hypothetical protein
VSNWKSHPHTWLTHASHYSARKGLYYGLHIFSIPLHKFNLKSTILKPLQKLTLSVLAYLSRNPPYTRFITMLTKAWHWILSWTSLSHPHVTPYISKGAATQSATNAIRTEKYLPLLPMWLATQTSVRYVRYVSCVAECLILGCIFKTSRWTCMHSEFACRCQLRASVISHSDYNMCYVSFSAVFA